MTRKPLGLQCDEVFILFSSRFFETTVKVLQKFHVAHLLIEKCWMRSQYFITLSLEKVIFTRNLSKIIQ